LCRTLKYCHFFLLLFISSVAIGQKAASTSPNQPTWLSESPMITFPSGTIPGVNASELASNSKMYFVISNIDLRNQNTDLVLSQNTSSPYARYITFTETFMGTEIYGTSLKIGIDKVNKIISVISKTGNVDNWPSNMTIPDPDTLKIKSAIGAYDNIDIKKTWFYTVNSGVPAYQVNCMKLDGTRDEELILDATNYNIIYRNNLIKNYKYPDSLVSMYVFYPNPLTSAQSPYRPPYSTYSLYPFPNTNNDSNSKSLDSQMIPMPIRVSVLKTDSFFLENEFVAEKDLGPPYAPAYPETTYSNTPVFHFNRDSSAFRDLMIYYTINNYRNHLKDIGYDSLGDSQIFVDPSGETDDQSTFYAPSGSQAGRIYFGVGGEPDGEDADIPMHEYTHFLSYSACHNCSSGSTERGALDEGTADYFAASNHKFISTYNWQKIFPWDGNDSSEQWYGRSCAITNTYPTALGTFNDDIHLCGQLWSSALMEIWDSIGRTKTDRIMLETLYSMASGMSMPQAARIYIKNDSLMYNGADVHTITYHFVKRGFLPESALVVTPQSPQIWYKITTSYFQSANKVLFEFALPQSGTLSLYDITGKLISSQVITNSEQVQFNAPQIAAGMYILNVNTEGLQKSFKLLK